MANLRVKYDRRADVLYVSTNGNGPAYARESDSGIVWRYLTSDSSLVGATIIDYNEIWSDRLNELIEELSSHFHVPKPSAAKALEQVGG
jgi:hypothetical protein